MTTAVPRRLAVLALLAWLSAVASESQAQPATIPTGLNPGDEYRLLFATSVTRDATSTNIADYNAFVTGVANTIPHLAGLGTTWTVVGSTAAVDARDNTGTHPGVTPGVPIYNLADTRLADDNADLWDGALAMPVATDESGAPAVADDVLTGTDGSGQGASGLALGDIGAVSGEPFSTGSWIDSGLVYESSVSLHFYALSDVLVVPSDPSAVPSMSPWSLLLLSGALLLGYRYLGSRA
jgi:hypothetical protein